MFQRLRDLDQSATDRGVAILTALQEHTSLQEQWTRFAKELVNRCEDLGLEMAQFHRKLTKRGTPQQEHENVLETIDWFELCFFLSYQLLVRTEYKTSAANNFPTRLPRKVQDLWPRKKMRIIGEQFEKIASGCEYEGLEPMRKADVRWCFTADTFATELQRHRLFEWRRFSQPSRLENASENNEHHKENDVVDGVHNSKTSEQEPVRSSLGAINFSVAGREEVQNINALLRGDYRIRRELMLERLNVTLESFMWSKRGQEVEQEVVEEFKQLLSGLSKEPCTVNIDDILRADPMALVPSDSGDEVMKSSHLRSLVIGQVPDRGGRIDDLNEKDMKRAARGAWDLQRSNRKSQSIKAATEKLPTLEIRLQLSQDTNGVDMKNIERHKKKKKNKSVPKQDAPHSPSPTKDYP